MAFKDPEKWKAYQKAWHEANREKQNARSKAYYEANKEKQNAYQKAYRKVYNEALPDKYVTQQTGPLPPEFIEIKRMTIKLRRILKCQKQSNQSQLQA